MQVLPLKQQAIPGACGRRDRGGPGDDVHDGVVEGFGGQEGQHFFWLEFRKNLLLLHVRFSSPRARTISLTRDLRGRPLRPLAARPLLATSALPTPLLP